MFMRFSSFREGLEAGAKYPEPIFTMGNAANNFAGSKNT
jgi:hypothetical protein